MTTPQVSPLLIEKVADAHPKRIRDLMQASQGHFLPPVHNRIDQLATDTAQPSAQLRIAHVFFIITRRRFNCEVYCFCFIFISFYVCICEETNS